jgi:hypothetical protein
MEQNKPSNLNRNPDWVICQSAEQFEAMVDERMQHEPWKGMDRSEARRIIAGMGILAERRMPEDVDLMEVELSEADLEEAKRLCEEAEAQGRHPFGFPIHQYRVK